jgi:serine/threonine-protein kinase TNNI3K
MIGFVLPTSGTSAKIVTEYMPNGSLEELLATPARYNALSTTTKVMIAVGIALGMRYLHAHGVFHRDLKPSNILLDERYEVRIADFRTSRFADLMGLTMTGGMGTSHFYSAPEISSSHYSIAVDIFSYSMLLWEILTGRQVVSGYPGGKDPGFVVHAKRVEGGARPSTVGLEPDAVGLLEACWDSDPGDRMPFEEIVKYLRDNNYQILPDVDGEVVARYVARIEEYETRHPPSDLSAQEEVEEE